MSRTSFYLIYIWVYFLNLLALLKNNSNNTHRLFIGCPHFSCVTIYVYYALKENHFHAVVNAELISKKEKLCKNEM